MAAAEPQKCVSAHLQKPRTRQCLQSRITDILRNVTQAVHLSGCQLQSRHGSELALDTIDRFNNGWFVHVLDGARPLQQSRVRNLNRASTFHFAENLQGRGSRSRATFFDNYEQLVNRTSCEPLSAAVIATS